MAAPRRHNIQLNLLPFLINHIVHEIVSIYSEIGLIRRWVEENFLE